MATCVFIVIALISLNLTVALENKFIVINNKQTFQNARFQCQLTGGDVVHIFNQQQQNEVNDYLKSFNDGAWIGLYGSRKDPELYWIGAPEVGIPFSNWDEGETAMPHRDFSETCVIASNNGKWNRVKCGDHQMIFCQENVVDENDIPVVTTMKPTTPATTMKPTTPATTMKPTTPATTMKPTTPAKPATTTQMLTTSTTQATTVAPEDIVTTMKPTTPITPTTTITTTQMSTTSTTKPTTVAPDQCKDSSTVCLALAEKGLCLDKDIQFLCNASCGLCGGTKQCKNDNFNCFRVANSKSCMKKIVRETCPLSCDSCIPQYVTYLNSKVPCSLLKDHCNDPWLRYVMKTYCRKTCGSCRRNSRLCYDRGMECRNLNGRLDLSKVPSLKVFCPDLFNYCNINYYDPYVTFIEEKGSSFECEWQCYHLFINYRCYKRCMRNSRKKVTIEDPRIPCQDAFSNCRHTMVLGLLCNINRNEANLQCPETCGLCKGTHFKYEVNIGRKIH